MNQIFVKTYYSLLFYILFQQIYCFNYGKGCKYMNINSLQTPDYALFASPLNFLNPPHWIHPLIFLFCLVFCFLCIVSPSKYLKIAVAVFTLILFSIKYSYGKISHLYHIWMISSVLMCFFSLNKPIKSTENQLTLKLIQAILLSHYFISGLWKLRSMVSTKFEFSMKEIAKEYITYNFAGNAHETNMLLNLLLYKYPQMLSFGYSFILLFQLTSLLPVFFNRFFVFYGFLAILFHFSTGVVLDIYFFPTVLAVLFFLIIAEFMTVAE